MYKRNVTSHKAKKEGKPHGKKPPPKREIKRHDVWMDGVIKTPSLRHTSSIYSKELGEGQNIIRGKIPPHTREEEGDKVIPPLKKSVCQ